jgi:NitT/TauT family transport system permease protein
MSADALQTTTSLTVGGRWLQNILEPLLGATIFVAAWAFAAMWFDITTFPGPVETFREFIRLVGNGDLLFNASISAFRIVLGFLIGCAIGVPLGFMMGISGLTRRLLEPFTEFLRFVPAISMIFFAIIWFGIGEASKVFLITFNTTFLVIINTEVGVRAVNRNALRAAAMLGASQLQQFLRVVIPATVPYVVTGMRIALGRSFTTIAAAEMVGASAGIGSLIFGARQFGRMDTVLVGIVTLAVMGLLVDALFRWLSRRLSGEFAGGLFRN